MDIVGIDLGTTTSEIAIFRKQAPQMIRDERGDEIILSIVGIDTKTRIMGVGKNFRSGEAEEMKSIDQIKRKMGSTEKVKLGDAEY
ncbi:MAG: Hsp70 family protein, partial [Ignavibacteriales bacterium]|nr:Hsp70 family protein [Ignavibacteriales bacterium]